MLSMPHWRTHVHASMKVHPPKRLLNPSLHSKLSSRDHAKYLESLTPSTVLALHMLSRYVLRSASSSSDSSSMYRTQQAERAVSVSHGLQVATSVLNTNPKYKQTSPEDRGCNKHSHAGIPTDYQCQHLMHFATTLRFPQS